MSGLPAVNFTVALLVLLLSSRRAVGNALSFCRGRLITICHATGAAAIALAGILNRRLARNRLLLSSLALAALPVSCIVSGCPYPAGDDGGGLGRLLFVGSSSALALLVGCVTAILGRRKPRLEHTGAGPK